MLGQLTSRAKNVASMVDLSILGAATQKASVDEIVRIGSATGCATVCVNPCYVAYVAAKLAKGRTKLCSVVGYPFGQHSTATKIVEARQAVQDGAEELDMVANVGFFKDGGDAEVGAEIAGIVKAADGRVVKVIIESCCLERDELVRMGELVVSCGAQFVKTSSGFGTAGGTLEEVQLLHESLLDRAKVKISSLGGGLTFEQAVEFIEAGASRIGTRLACPMMDTIRKAMEVD